MSRIHDRQRAIQLRQLGKTYSEIRKEIKIAKSTLSDWLRNFPLTEAQMITLQRNRKYNKQIGIEKTRIIKEKKRQTRITTTYETEKARWVSLTKRELELAGLFLYWGEGNKNLKASVSLNNTDPKVLKFTLYWLTNGLGVPKEKIKIYVHLYSDMEVEKELFFWSKELNLPLTQFMKPYIKDSKRIDITHKGYGHGTCGLVVHNTMLKEKIILGISAIADIYSISQN